MIRKPSAFDRLSYHLSLKVRDNINKPLLIGANCCIEGLTPLEMLCRNYVENTRNCSFSISAGSALAFSQATSSHLRLPTIQSLACRQCHQLQQVLPIARITVVSIWFIAPVSMLMIFKGIRQIGVSLPASSGVAIWVIGIAAQKTLGNLPAGIQIAFTQPIRIDDVVIVGGNGAGSRRSP